MTRYPFVHTYSIVARDPVTGDFGVAVQSHWFSVGTVVTWAEAGVGAIATQAMAEISYGPLGLELMRGGKTAAQTLQALLSTDEGCDLRQVAMVDKCGEIATHTGSKCIQKAGHLTGEGFSVQANMMLNDTVWQAMHEAYQSALTNPAIDLAERMLLALEAAEASGGDIRGKQSAAIKIVSAEPGQTSWGGVLMELRIEDHPTPIPELRRLVSIHRAYEYMNKGDEFLGKGAKGEAMQAYASAVKLAPQIVEIPFWNAVTLADNGNLEEALPVFKDVFAKEPVWKELLIRLPASGLIKDDAEMLKRILSG
jgi:uncharacterized Ntn-hydrolase superfamily protein